MTCVFFRDCCIFRTKSALLGMISGDHLFFFRDHCISRTKSALPGMTSSDDLCFLKITLNLGRKLVLQIPNFMTWFWHANCMSSLRGHRTPLQQLLFRWHSALRRQVQGGCSVIFFGKMVMFGQDGCHVGHSAVADLCVVLVANFVKTMTRNEVIFK